MAAVVRRISRNDRRRFVRLSQTIANHEYRAGWKTKVRQEQPKAIEADNPHFED
jgi:hypothetical protein